VYDELNDCWANELLADGVKLVADVLSSFEPHGRSMLVLVGGTCCTDECCG